jgi:hypothetical protein
MRGIKKNRDYTFDALQREKKKKKKAHLWRN